MAIYKKRKKKRRAPAGSISNLVPGSHAKEPDLRIFPAAWDTFCIHYKLTGNQRKAAQKAGYTSGYAGLLMRDPRVQERLKTIDQKQLSKALEDAREEYVLCEDLLDKGLVKVVNSYSHERRGYADVVAAIRHGNELLGRVSNNKTTINNSANAQAGIGGINAFQVYESAWLKEKKQEFEQRLEAKYGNDSPETHPD